MRMTWLKSLFPTRLPHRSKRNSRATRGNTPRFRPRLETLEDRTLLSTFAVQVFDDGTPVQGTTTTSTSNGLTSLTFIGSSTNFSYDIVLGTTNSPGTQGGASLELGPQSQVNTTTTGNHTLTIELTSTDYSLPTGSSIVVSNSAGGEYVGGGSVTATYQTFFDPNDDAFGMPAGDATPLETATASGSNSLVFSPGTASGTFERPNPLFSLTSVATFTIDAAGGDIVNLGGTAVASASPMASPTISTTQQPATATVGTAIADQATVSGGNNPTGTVAFNLYNNSSASGTPLFTDTENLVNGVGISASYTPTATGTDYWVATYNGDSNNSAVTSSPTAEPVTITPTTPSIITSQQPASATVGSSIADTATVTSLVNASSGDEVTFNLYSSATVQNSTTLLFSDTEPVSLSGSTATATSKGYTATATGTDYWVATFNGDSNNDAVTSGATAEPVTIVSGTPDIAVTKTADSASVAAGQTIGFTITITNSGNAAATGVNLQDNLPPGSGGDVFWTIDTSNTGLGAGTDPSAFSISGPKGNQVLTLNGQPITLAAGASLKVHITSPTNAGDVSGGAVGVQSGVSSSAYLGAAGDYGVLDMVGSSTHTLQITNVTIGANIGVGSSVGGNGIGNVTFSGPGTITGRLDFAPDQTNSFSNNNGTNVGPASVNTNVAAVTSAISTVTSLNSSLGALAGTSLAINGTQTINESAGTFYTVSGVTYSVFSVKSYRENNGDLFTINGDGSGDPVVLNFGSNTGNINLGGDVVLAGNGLNDDKVIWNFTSSNQHIQLNNNASSYPNVAFHGIILAPNDAISLVNANMSGRVFGGDNQDMQIVSGDTIHAPVLNTATVIASNVTFDSDDTSSASITITGTTFKTSNLTTPGTPTTATSQLTIPLTNNGSTNVVLTGISIAWPSATDGNLQQVTLGGNVVVYGGSAGIAGPSYSTSSLQGSTTIKAGATSNLVFYFKNNIQNTGYTITLTFSDGSTLNIAV